MKIIGIVLLWLIALVALALFSWGVSLYFDWPLWLAGAVFVAGVGVYFLIKFLLRTVILVRSRSRLAQAAIPRGEFLVSGEESLACKWRAAVTTLRQSSLRRFGNPLYVLPWFMVIGQSGAGKTTALTRARLSSPIRKVSQQAGIEQTANCDWWYFDRAVVVDCAGRYVDPREAHHDYREWKLGLDLLGRYRRREGLDGLVLAVSADKLLSPDPDALAEEGRVVRTRIEELIRMFGKRFPIYVLVTKCDRLYGFEEWAMQLSDVELDQAMGYLSEELVEGEADFVIRAFDSVGERLGELRIAMIAGGAQMSPELLTFPNEFDQLRSGLTQFIRACMGDSPYLERPLLRGIFFSSGQQEGGAVSSLPGATARQTQRHPRENAGLFLRDIFGRILPQDLHAAKPAALVNRWHRVTENLGVAAWVLALFAVGILLTVSFVGSMRTLQLVRSGCTNATTLTGQLEESAAALSCASGLLVQLENNNRRWLSGVIGNTAGLGALEARLKHHFVSQYRLHIEPAADEDWQAESAPAGASDPQASRGRRIINLARSIALLQARRHGADHASLEAMPQPMPTARYALQTSRQMNSLAIQSLAASPSDDPYLDQRMKAERAELDRLVYADSQMSWLTGLIPDTGAIAPVWASDFWGRSAVAGANGPTGEAMVSAVFTVKGKDALDQLVIEIQRSVSDPVQFSSRHAVFEKWYHDQRVLAWQNFVEDFVRDPTPFTTEGAWRAALSSTSGAQSSYFRVTARLADEFNGESEAQLPAWLILARQFHRLREQTTQLGAASPAIKVVGAINAVGGVAIRQSLAGAPQQGRRTVTDNLDAVKALTLYLTELHGLAVEGSAGSGKDYQLAANFHQFSPNLPAQPSAVQNALTSLTRLKGLLAADDHGDALTWRLIAGPLNFVLTYVEQQASCELQKSWESNVLWPLQGAPDQAAMMTQLFDTKGTVWDFVGGVAKPFLVRNANNYDVVQTGGYSVPFAPEFLPMLNSGLDRQISQQNAQRRNDADKQNQQLQAQQDQLAAQTARVQLETTLADAKAKADAARAEAIPIAISAQPTGVNDEAKAKPFLTALKIYCAAGVQTLNNYNFPVNASFAWSASQCGEASLQIKIGNLTLNRKYAGPLGFATFLRDFRGGLHQFVPADFPGEEAGLTELGVQEISLRYRFDGLDAVLEAARKIDEYETLQTTVAKRKQQVEEAQLEKQQQSLAQQLAGQTLLASAQTIVASVPNLRALTLPQRVGLCWSAPVSVIDGG